MLSHVSDNRTSTLVKVHAYDQPHSTPARTNVVRDNETLPIRKNSPNTQHALLHELLERRRQLRLRQVHTTHIRLMLSNAMARWRVPLKISKSWVLARAAHKRAPQGSAQLNPRGKISTVLLSCWFLHLTRSASGYEIHSQHPMFSRPPFVTVRILTANSKYAISLVVFVRKKSYTFWRDMG